MSENKPEEKLLRFAAAAPAVPKTEYGYKYKVIVADDDKDVHTVTQLVLKNFIFEGAGIEFIDTYSGEETIQALKDNDDIAVILLDVVMEENTSGLDVVEYTRNVLKNDMTRIILKTGQPGIAPEERVIIDYDINDYKSKAELTAQKFTTTLHTAIRNYRDLRKLANHKKGLEMVIASSADFYHYNNLKEFFSGLLSQLNNLRNFHSDAFMASTMRAPKEDSFIAYSQENQFHLIAGTGRFSGECEKPLNEMNLKVELTEFLKSKRERTLYYKKDNECYIGYYKGYDNSENLIYLEGQVNEINEDMIRLFLTNFSFAFDRLFMNKKMIGGMKQIIMMLGELIEYRDGETGSHVRRVSEMVYLMAKKAGKSDEECDDLSIASMVHDIGKIAIDDAILRKPGKLTTEEFAIIKEHTSTGYAILKDSTISTIRIAAEIALNHHEKWEGGGYPNNISGEEIPWAARLTAIVDVFDALANKRYYKDAWPEQEIFDLLKKEKGIAFDPPLVELFFENRDAIMEIQKKYPDS
ncbi:MULTISPECIES: HD domain-containing phosphohydrolase [unclassified Oceanispirochaeta]|uniref:DUF3369 domain-containing protein n=1 Tax=unclassified Oceanispirochaeta TaxID=2635722 RepID=UPI000E097F93|nr:MULTISPECIES: HD domain-containing phosphohydrolase [unclassified Oceanispirochaeta]MBF9018868.1 DUF3369 domain-containing protein [Oceanispirochaeta sp. M2]NPD75356.1 DUF3369 domain-containing protein [Oceanispirochaeta sp. M1]RDG28784.1 DUF3369 domain-containing protein [Oceanispirochaeta sp. M1]